MGFPLPIAEVPVRVRVKTCLFEPPASHTGTPYCFAGVVHVPLGPRHEVGPGYQPVSEVAAASFMYRDTR